MANAPETKRDPSQTTPSGVIDTSVPAGEVVQRVLSTPGPAGAELPFGD